MTIKRVAEHTGVSVYTLRAWERRYGVPRPRRGQTNRYRLYDEEDVADVLLMKQRIEQGIPPSEAGALLHERHASTPRSNLSTAGKPMADHEELLLAALVNADEPRALRLLGEAFALFGPEQVGPEMLPRVMNELGDLWLRGDISIWQEHLATNIVRRQLASIRQAQATSTRAAPRLIAACAPREQHELGLQALAILAAKQGWRVSYLGQRTPLDEAVQSAHDEEAYLIAVSVSTVLGLSSLLPWLDKSNHPPVALVFGGSLLERMPELQARLPGLYLPAQQLDNLELLLTRIPRSDYWDSPRRSYHAACIVQNQRQEVVGSVAAAIKRDNVHPIEPGMEELMLVDAVACALAFELPTILEAQVSWLKSFSTHRGYRNDWLTECFSGLKRSLSRLLAPDVLAQVKPLLARLP
jgi:DNA-binding transcriptional MerR regulator